MNGKRVFFDAVFAFIAGLSPNIDSGEQLVLFLAQNVISAAVESQSRIENDPADAMKPDDAGVPSDKLREIAWKSIDTGREVLEHSFIAITLLLQARVELEMMTPGNVLAPELRFLDNNHALDYLNELVRVLVTLQLVPLDGTALLTLLREHVFGGLITDVSDVRLIIHVMYNGALINTMSKISTAFRVKLREVYGPTDDSPIASVTCPWNNNSIIKDFLQVLNGSTSA